MAPKLKAITFSLLVLFIVLVLLDLATFGVLIGVGKLAGCNYIQISISMIIPFFLFIKPTVHGSCCVLGQY